MRLTSLNEAIVSHKYDSKQSEWPGIQMSKVLVDFVSKLLPTDNTHIQILPRKEEWASTIKITHKNAAGRSKSVEIHVIVKPEEAYASIRTPGTIGVLRPGQRPVQQIEINRYDLIDPRSFEKSAAAAVEYLNS